MEQIINKKNNKKSFVRGFATELFCYNETTLEKDV